MCILSRMTERLRRDGLMTERSTPHARPCLLVERARDLGTSGAICPSTEGQTIGSLTN
jgi:hypothetical protein